jgi:bacteriocin-like protein
MANNSRSEIRENSIEATEIRPLSDDELNKVSGGTGDPDEGGQLHVQRRLK